ncbi:hypothetical protein O6H91_03G064100 [Diphasiastrum complanatum]|uniref:Uncharacterized protein n=1 Tax=Diphasiastrum complanatum TaxID=34168 RepID=A0ACC2E756_DIPCM|nr:hypothetical protein O6H91_03G064100 [Diphasiastrum complanatum]
MEKYSKLPSLTRASSCKAPPWMPTSSLSQSNHPQDNANRSKGRMTSSCVDSGENETALINNTWWQDLKKFGSRRWAQPSFVQVQQLDQRHDPCTMQPAAKNVKHKHGDTLSKWKKIVRKLKAKATYKSHSVPPVRFDYAMTSYEMNFDQGHILRLNHPPSVIQAEGPAVEPHVATA